MFLCAEQTLHTPPLKPKVTWLEGKHFTCALAARAGCEVHTYGLRSCPTQDSKRRCSEWDSTKVLSLEVVDTSNSSIVRLHDKRALQTEEGASSDEYTQRWGKHESGRSNEISVDARCGGCCSSA